MVKANSFPDKVLPLIWFLSTSGYYLLMVVMLEAGIMQTRLMTVPARVLPVIFALYYLQIRKSYFFHDGFVTIIWIWTMAFYSLRVVYDLNIVNFEFFMSDVNYYMYVLTSFIFPPIVMSVNFSINAWDNSKKWVLWGSVAVSLLGFFLYRDVFSEFGRIRGITDEYVSISPLAISYTSLIALTYFTFRLVKNVIKENIFILAAGLLGSIPGILLGSSRGSILGYLVVLLLLFIAKGYMSRLTLIIFIILLSFPVMYELSVSFGSNLLPRVVNTYLEIQSGEYFETDRPFLWKTAINNFNSSPIWGDLIENRGIGHHPHNIIIEAFMSMGILGGIPFLIILSYLWFLFFKIAKNSHRFDWVLVIFGISFMQNMVTGAIWSAVWLWTSAGALISINYKLKFSREYLYKMLVLKRQSLQGKNIVKGNDR